MEQIELFSKLKELEGIADNPNIKYGVWKSFQRFISLCDEILNHSEDFKKLPISSADVILREISNIREEFKEKCGVEIQTQCLGMKFEKAKNNRATAHLFMKKVSNFMKGYKGHFIRWDSRRLSDLLNLLLKIKKCHRCGTKFTKKYVTHLHENMEQQYK